MGQNDNRGPRRDAPPPRSQPLAPSAMGLPEGLISDVQTVTEALVHLSSLDVNLLAPLTRIEFIPAGFRLAFRAILFPFGDFVNVGGKKTNGTWYEADDGGGWALHKTPLRQLAAAAGLSWTTVDMSREPNRWTYKAVGRLRTMDGQWRELSATKDLDLRDDGPVIPTWQAEAARNDRSADRRILKAREAGGRMAESKAVNALIRDALGLRTAYPEKMARAPFVFPFLVWTPETAEARQLQAAVELGVVAQVFGPASAGRVYAEAGTVIDGDAIPAARQLEAQEQATPDFRKQAEKLAQRERVERRPSQERAPYGHQEADAPSGPDPKDVEAYRIARGWDPPKDAQQRAGLLAYVTGKGRADFERFLATGDGPDTNPDW